MDYHSYTEKLDVFDIWHTLRWKFFYDKCGFDINSISKIYMGETGLDNGKGFVGNNINQSGVTNWINKFVTVQSEMFNGKPSPVIGGALFQLGGNGDKRWYPFELSGYTI
jgi:hypothetical protein